MSSKTLCQSYRIAISFLVFVAGIGPGRDVFAQIDRDLPGSSAQTSRAISDDRAKAFVFGHQFLRQNGVHVVERSRQMSMEVSYDFLRQWVVPNNVDSVYCITTDFVPATHALAEQTEYHSDNCPTIVSPTKELVRLAVKLNRVGELAEYVESCPTSHSVDKCNKAALLSILAMADGDESAEGQLEQSLDMMLDSVEVLDEVRESFLLCVEQAAKDKRFHEIVRADVHSVIQRYTPEVSRKAWHRHLWAVHARLNLADGVANPDLERTHDPQWLAVSRTSAFQHGNGFPRAQWRVDFGTARNLSSRDDDFLFFVSPLRGDFEVETHATGFGFRDSHLMYAGRWVAPLYDHKHYVLGNVRGENSRVKLDQPISDSNSHGFIHQRFSVRDREVATYLSGRPIHRQKNRGNQVPWLAVRSAYRQDGGVDDLRITGSPTIPMSIDLIDGPELLGWHDYFQRTGPNSNRLSAWKAIDSSPRPDDGEHEFEITDALADVPRGSHAERLLVYMRPFLEDGDIEYEFFYAPGKTLAAPAITSAAPAIGRNCFLLNPDGVYLHTVTDGVYDSTRTRPGNAIKVTSDSTDKLPLLPNDWNKISLSLRGDTLALNLNDKAILTAKIRARPSERHFGLFHFADQCDLRVRRIRWQGGWPHSMPRIEEQKLVDPLAKKITKSTEALKESYHHSFGEKSLLGGELTIVEGDADDIQETQDGFILTRKGKQGYSGSLVGSNLTIGGDFEVTVGFDQLGIQAKPGEIGSVRMFVRAENDESDLAMIQRALDRSSQHIVQCMKRTVVEGSQRSHYFAGQPIDAMTGRLRLTRIGDQIYYQFSENDSSQFRVIAQKEFTTADIPRTGLRFGIQIQSPGNRTVARLKDLTIRAERIGGRQTVDRESLLAELNKESAELPVALKHDFTAKAPDDRTISRWTDERPWDSSAGGLPIRCPGTDKWSSAGFAVLGQFQNDFDVHCSLDKIDLAVPKKGMYSQAYLQVELDDKDDTQYNVIIKRNDQDNLVADAQVRHRVGAKYDYEKLASVSIEQIDQLRILRRGSKIHFVVGNSPEKNEYVLATTDATKDTLKYFGIRLMVHTGGAERVSEMLVKSLEIRASESSFPNLENANAGVPVPINAPANRPQRTRGFFDMLQDLLP